MRPWLKYSLGVLLALSGCGRHAATAGAGQVLALPAAGPAPAAAQCAPIPAASAAAAIQRCINAAPVGSVVGIPAGTYTLQSQVVLNRGVKLQARGGAVTLRPKAPEIGLVMPDFPNASRLDGITVSYDLTGGKFDIVPFVKPLIPNNTGRGLKDQTLGITNTSQYYEQGAAGHLWWVKGGHANAFTRYFWDATGVYLKQEINAPDALNEMVAASMQYARRLTYVGDSVVTQAIPQRVMKNQLPNPCEVTATVPRAYVNQRTYIAGRMFMDLGGDLGQQEVVVWNTVHDTTIPTSGHEVFYWARGQGLVGWKQLDGAGNELAGFLTNMAGTATAPDSRYICQ